MPGTNILSIFIQKLQNYLWFFFFVLFKVDKSFKISFYYTILYFDFTINL